MKSVVLGLIFCIAVISSARADIKLSPLRQVIGPATPEASFEVSNPSNRILEGRITWIDLTATETGYAPAAAAQRPSLSAAPFLTISPAQFRLEPGARIKVNVRLKDGAVIPKGERRSHLLIETAATRTPIRKASDNGLQIDIGLGISAPVILRNGGKAKARIGETKLLRDDEGLLLLETSILPGGDNSAYGRIEVLYKPHDDPKGVKILGVRDNVAGFLDAPSRKIETPLGFVTLEAGELTIRYEGAAEYEGRLFDRRTFEIAPPPK